MASLGSGSRDARMYVIAWVALLGLTALSFGAHYLDLGAFATPVSLAFAAVKATIVFAVFMHLARESTSIRMIAVLNVAWVVLICAGIALDVAAD